MCRFHFGRFLSHSFIHSFFLSFFLYIAFNLCSFIWLLLFFSSSSCDPLAIHNANDISYGKTFAGPSSVLNIRRWPTFSVAANEQNNIRKIHTKICKIITRPNRTNERAAAFVNCHLVLYIKARMFMFSVESTWMHTLST